VAVFGGGKDRSERKEGIGKNRKEGNTKRPYLSNQMREKRGGRSGGEIFAVGWHGKGRSGG